MSEHTPLTEAEREALTNCDCGHDIGGEHNGLGCYGTVDYGSRTQRRCDCTETDNRPSVNYAAVERILAARTSTATADDGLRERVEAVICNYLFLKTELLNPPVHAAGIMRALADDGADLNSPIRREVQAVLNDYRAAHEVVKRSSVGSEDSWWDRLNRALAATAAPTTDTGARDE